MSAMSGYKTNDLRVKGKKKTLDYLHLAEQKPEVFQPKFSKPGWLMHSEGLPPRAEGHRVNVIKRVGVMF